LLIDLSLGKVNYNLSGEMEYKRKKLSVKAVKALMEHTLVAGWRRPNSASSQDLMPVSFREG
jgi:hypothetical protein